MTFRWGSLIAKPSASRRVRARTACMARSRPGKLARSAISVAVAGSDVSAASTRGRVSWRGRAPRGDGTFGMVPGYRGPASSTSPQLAD